MLAVKLPGTVAMKGSEVAVFPASQIDIWRNQDLNAEAFVLVHARSLRIYPPLGFPQTV